MNNKLIPRVLITKRINLDDLTSKDFIASPDYCDLCITQIIRFLERKGKLFFSVNGNRIIQSITQVANNQSI